MKLYNRLNKNEIREIECMIINDVSLNNIAKITGKNKTTIYYHFRKIKGRTCYPISGISSNEELIGEFIGLFAGDGCFYKDVNSKYKIQLFFNITESAYVDDLMQILEQIFGKYPSRYTRLNKVILTYFSKNIYDLILHYLEWNPAERKTHSVRLKNSNYSKEFKIGFLRGSLDSDGYFSDKSIMFASSSKALIENIKSFLEDLEIPYHYNEYVEKRPNRVNMHHVNIRRIDRTNFINLINPRERKNIKNAPVGIRILEPLN